MTTPTKVYTDSTLDTEIDVMTDLRSIPGVSGGNPANVEYVAIAGGDPGSPNTVDVDATQALKVFSSTMEAQLATLVAQGSDPTPTPVSVASLPLPTNAAQDGVDITTPAPMPAGGVGIRGWLSAQYTTLIAVLAKLNASIAVTGTFWQNTQPVSGTFFQATQPTSNAAAAQVDGHSATLGATTDVAVVGDNPGSLSAKFRGWLKTFGIMADAVWDGAATSVSAMSYFRYLGVKLEAIRAAVTDPTAVSIIQAQAQTKGTRDANGIQTQQIKDTGRSSLSMLADQFRPGQATEILIDFKTSAAHGTRSANVNNYTVTALKTLRGQLLTAMVTTNASNTALAFIILRMRVNTGGAATITSPIAHEWILSGTAGAANAVVLMPPIHWPDGEEFAAGTGITWTAEVPSWVTSSADPKITFDYTAFEY